MSKKSSRRNGKSSRSVHKKNAFQYTQLEARNLLAVNLGINITGHTKNAQSDVIDPNMVGDVGPTHYIESIKDKLSFFDRTTATRTLFKTPNQFFLDIGGAVTSTITNVQVIYDRLENRWLMLGEGSGNGNYLYLAISDTSNPMQGWKSLRFVGDSTGIRHNGELNIAVDADAMIITSRNVSTQVGTTLSVSVFTIPKVDLYAANPTLTNMSRFENRAPSLMGDYLRASISLEASDGKATVIGSRGDNTLKTDILNVHAAGATITTPVRIDFNASPLIIDYRNFGRNLLPPLGEQESDEDVFIDPYLNMTLPNVYTPNPPPVTLAPVLSNPYDYNGGLWFVQEALIAYPAGIARGVFWYEINKATSQILQGGVVPPPTLTPAGLPAPRPDEWDMYNPGFSINEFGLLQINTTASTEEYDVFPSAVSSIAQQVNGKAIYDPIFDTIYYNNAEPGKESRNTQFETAKYIQAGLEVYENNGSFPGAVSSWSYRGSTGWDPNNYNRFWSSTQWANTVSRWSTQATELIPIDMEPIITADETDNVIVLRRKAGRTELLEIEIDGMVTDILPYEPIGRVIINGFDGDDVFSLDYTNGNPVPKNGFEFNGMRGADRIETNNPDGSHFFIDGSFVNIYGQGLNPPGSTANSGSGYYNDLTGFTGIEDVRGGEGPDILEVSDKWELNQPDDPYFQISHGYLAGSMIGNGGDDTFKFSELGEIGDSIDGGDGSNTLSFENRWAGGPKAEFDGKRNAPVILQLYGISANGGYDGFAPDDPLYDPAVDGPIGDDPRQDGDNFRNINFMLGGEFSIEDVRGIDEQAYVFVDDENSYYEAGGGRLGFFQINALSTSSFNDHFVGIRNSVDPLALAGLGGDDLYDFSSDAPTNEGHTADLDGLLFAQGGTGANTMNVSNKSGAAVDALILNNRISGLGEIAYSAEGGTFALNVWASQFSDHIDLHSFFFTNTLNLFLLAGDDTMSIQDLSKATINLHGGLGDDVFTVEKIQDIDLRNLSIIDSVGSERDRVQLAGTILNETFTIIQTTFTDLNVAFSGIEWFGVDTRGGNDIINLQTFNFEFLANGGDGNDIINISSDAAINLGTVGGFVKPITVEGGTGRNELRISNFSGLGKSITISKDKIVGLLGPVLASPVLNFFSTGGTFDLLSGIGGITITGANTGNDVFTVSSLNVDDSLKILGVGGDDRFLLRTVNSLGDVEFDGGAAVDSFEIDLLGNLTPAAVRMVNVRDDSTGELLVNGTGVADILTLAAAKLSRGAESVTLLSAINKYTIDAGGGDDSVTVDWSTGVANLDVFGGAGLDTVNLNVTTIATYSRLLGGIGNDNLNVGTNVSGNVRVDGEAGADRAFVKFQSSGMREVDARDTGTVGTESDVLFVVGLATAETMEVRTNLVSMVDQRTLYDDKTNRLIVQGIGGDDTINVFGSVSPITQVQGGTGNDRVVVNSTTGSTQLTLDGNDGQDRFTVYRTAVETNSIIRGGPLDDRFDIGSTLEENSGNLGLMRGRIAVQGNDQDIDGEDRLYLNDFNVNVAYNYTVTPTAIRSIAGPNNNPRPNFAGVTFDGTVEFARLDGTIAANYFSVRPSFLTRFYIDGNLPSPIVGSGDTIFLHTTIGDGHFLRITDAPRGKGYWSFTNGLQEVRFEEIETLIEGTPQPPSFMMAPPSNGPGFQSFSPENLGFMRADNQDLDSLAGSISLNDDDDVFASISFDVKDLDTVLVEVGDSLEFDL
ncbi:MAG: hypothetical protein ABL888_08580 [Pirellulaceae bacterium]